MQRSLAKAWHTLPALRRNASSGWASTRWVNIARAESNIVTYDDPPTAPLPESNEAGEGASDFSNYVEKHEDVSTAQALSGLGIMMASMYAIFKISTGLAQRTPAPYTPRETPYLEKDIPILHKGDDVFL